VRTAEDIGHVEADDGRATERSVNPVTAVGRRQRRLATALALTGIVLAAEVVGGIATGSLALLADAGHMLTDVGGLALAWFATRFAARPATRAHTYGFYRAEILAALANAIVLLGIAAFILWEAYERLLSPPTVATWPMLAIASLGLVVNVIGVRVLAPGADESLNVKGAYFEALSDLVSSMGVIVAALVIWATGWQYADPLASAGIGLFIVPRTWKLLRQAVGILLEGTPSEVNIEALRSALLALGGVSDVHDLHVWALSSGVNAMSAHVVCAAATPSDDLLGRAHACVRRDFPIGHVTIQVEPQGWEEQSAHE